MNYYCEQCDLWWNYPVNKCLYCGDDTKVFAETDFTVIGSTEVYIPSKNNPKVPYYTYLLEDKNGNRRIIKSFEKYSINDKFYLNVPNTEKKYLIGVVGTGQMGLGIVVHMLSKNYRVVAKTRGYCEKIFDKIQNILSKNNSKNNVDNMLSRLTVTKDFNNLKSCDIIIESVLEDLEVKKKVFQELSNICKEDTILATNTSSISINDLALSTNRPDKVIGMHFFNPVAKMDLIEIVLGKKTSKATKNFVFNLSEDIDKKGVLINNIPGFVVNRLLIPQINEAIKLYEQGIASKEDIDSAIKLGLNHPMGPFKLADLIGLDVCLAILETMYVGDKNEKFKPADTLINLVKELKLGVKSKKGFYDY